MKLYQVVELADNSKAFVPTDEKFPSTLAFVAKVKNDGKAYEGKSWIILPEGKHEPKIMAIKLVEQFEISLEE